MVTVFVEILKSSVLLYLGFLNIRRYVLYLYIETLKQRLDAINQLRVDRALAAMGPAFQQVYSLLPTLLHYHHPLMPGYLDGNVPRGICLYTPDETQRHYLEELELHRGMQTQEPPKGELPITGVYSMGSTSSVGQSCSSDLDIWVCHQAWLDSEERQLLQRKCSLLESWAASLGVEVSFFLIDENRFRHNESGSLGGEDCGSTQHILLLDEFYRTAIWLAGRTPIWWLVPVYEEASYDRYTHTLMSKRFIRADETLTVPIAAGVVALLDGRPQPRFVERPVEDHHADNLHQVRRPVHPQPGGIHRRHLFNCRHHPLPCPSSFAGGVAGAAYHPSGGTTLAVSVSFM